MTSSCRSRLTATAELFFVENAVEVGKFVASHFFEAVFGVEMLCSHEDDGGIQVQHGVSQFSGSLFQGREDCLTKPASLQISVNTHSFYLGSNGGGSPHRPTEPIR